MKLHAIKADIVLILERWYLSFTIFFRQRFFSLSLISRTWGCDALHEHDHHKEVRWYWPRRVHTLGSPSWQHPKVRLQNNLFLRNDLHLQLQRQVLFCSLTHKNKKLFFTLQNNIDNDYYNRQLVSSLQRCFDVLMTVRSQWFSVPWTVFRAFVYHTIRARHEKKLYIYVAHCISHQRKTINDHLSKVLSTNLTQAL